ncbi:31424_t:CDS:2, partial [Racocetra persica]
MVESKTATIADCFVEYIKLAIAINQIPNENVLKNNIINIFNRRYNEFDRDAYLLGYFLYPEYPLLNNQEITLSEIVEQANNTLTISDIIDLTKLSLETDDQLRMN